MNALTPAIDRIVLTPGEPAGIGPDLCIQLAREPSTDSERIVIADPLLLLERAAQLGLRLLLKPFDPAAPRRASPANTLSIIPVSLRAPTVAGRLNVANAD